MMKNAWQCLVWCIFVLSLFVLGGENQLQAANSKQRQQIKPAKRASCMKCHDQWSDILPNTHQLVQNARFEACMQCHAPQGWGMAPLNKFDAHLHLTHLSNKTSENCLNCHQWKPGSGLALLGVPGKYGAFTQEEFNALRQIYLSAVGSRFLDNRHLTQGVSCSACHANGVIGQVRNSTCLSCHGPMETLVEKTAPQQHPDRNPHKSHLGEIDCTVCHMQHGPQKIYCLECHPKFDLHFK